MRNKHQILKSSAIAIIIGSSSIGGVGAVTTTLEATNSLGHDIDPIPSASTLATLAEKSKRNMVELASGSFEMGDWGTEVNPDGLPFSGDTDSKPLHKVKLSAFAIGKYPVTYEEFDVFTAAMRIPKVNQDTFSKKFRKPTAPAGVSWHGAKDYCSWLGTLTKSNVTIPTEAQWEYAARSGGRRTLFATDNGKIDEGRNVPSGEEIVRNGGIVAVDSFPPNPAGLYYFASAIWEWTNDWYGAEYYKESPIKDPQGPAAGEKKVVRGNFGSNPAMTFERYSRKVEEQTGAWKLSSKGNNGQGQTSKYTKYSAFPNNGFRCVEN